MAEPKLYVIATPLGNRGDITLRALDILKEVSYFCAEDTREFHKLLSLYGLSGTGKTVQSYAKHNLLRATEQGLEWLREGKDVGMVCDRGTPALSDPGRLLVAAAHAEGIQVVPVPGASSITAVLSVSGFSTDQFLFMGFLARTGKERVVQWQKIRELGIPTCLFESPQRIRDTLAEMKDHFPEGKVFLAREVTKMFETLTLLTWDQLKVEEAMERGEYVVVLDPGPAPQKAAGSWRDALNMRILSDKEWSKMVASQYDESAKEIYNALQKEKIPKT